MRGVVDGVVRITSGSSSAEVLPDEGAALVSFRWRGRQVLARTPWAATPSRLAEPAPARAPAHDEASWVERWRGGWQLCAPSTGQPSQNAPFFHGEASQARWSVVAAEPDAIGLAWSSSDGRLRLRRTWRLLDESTIEAESLAISTSNSPLTIMLAEHLILGDELLEPLRAGGAASMALPAEATPVTLDYDGRPSQDADDGDWRERWGRVDRTAPGRVIGLSHASPREVSVRGDEWRASVTWSGLDHVLLWQEIAATAGPPWSSEVVALGIEPTTTPHGAGLDGGGGVELASGATLRWSARLTLTGAQLETAAQTEEKSP